MTMRNPDGSRENVATRQATKQKMNVRVLATSLILIALIFAGLYFWFLSAPHSENQAPTPPDQSRQQGDTPATPAPPAAPAQPPAPTPTP